MVEQQQLIIEYLPLSELHPYKNNAKEHTEHQIEQIAESIRSFGFNDPIGIWKDEIVEGHGRLAAAKKLKLETVPVIRLDHLSDADRKIYILAHNKLTLNTGFDLERLAIEFEELKNLGADLDLTGFDAAEIDDLFSQVHDKDAKEDDFDIDAELESEEDPLVQPGDIWVLGRHRLMCGDSTKPEDVAILMDGKQANLCVTDPPYNCDYSGGTGMKIMNDKMSDADFKAFLLSAFTNIYNSIADGGAFYGFHSDSEKVNFYQATVEAGFHYSTTCVWVKNSLVLSRMDYQMRHEPIIYAFKNTAKHKWYSDRKQTSVWEFDRPTRSKLHPTTKPIPLVSYPIRNSSQVNGIVLDVFGGSGSTLIACEQMDRICYMMELDPKYAPVIVKRFRDHVGSDEGIYLIRDGEKIRWQDVVMT